MASLPTCFNSTFWQFPTNSLPENATKANPKTDGLTKVMSGEIMLITLLVFALVYMLIVTVLLKYPKITKYCHSRREEGANYDVENIQNENRD